MNRPFLFLSGESTVTMPLVFSDESWQHATVARRLVRNEDGTLRRDNLPRERLEGFVYFASVDSKEIRRANLQLLRDAGTPCWPDPTKLLELDDRFEVLRACSSSGLLDHEVDILEHVQRTRARAPFPLVLKVGNVHCGEGKHLVMNSQELAAFPPWEGIASFEPFFVGRSFRVLFVGSAEFLILIENPNSWIKNSAGAEATAWRVGEGGRPTHDRMVEHARRVRDRFDLEVAGIDYVLEDGSEIPRFLEVNQFPGVAASIEIESTAKAFFRERMDRVTFEARKR